MIRRIFAIEFEIACCLSKFIKLENQIGIVNYRAIFTSASII
jgi:hypothetical protein